MASKQLSKWQELNKSLKKLLVRYNLIKDFIIFGSFVKGKDCPKDIDIAVVMDKKDMSLVGDLKEQLDFSLDIEMIKPEEMYQTRLGFVLMSEGFSVKDGAFLRQKLGLSPMKIYTYEIKHLTQTKKVLFGRGLNTIIKKTKANKLGAGSIMVPIDESGKFEDFLNTWNLKYQAKEYLVL